MNPLTREWVSKAEGDLSTAERELRAWKKPDCDNLVALLDIVRETLRMALGLRTRKD
jgi:hypothetical protein